MRTALWPDQTPDDMADWLARDAATVIVAARPEDDGLIGFVEVGERDFADGCETRPVGYIEGWWVDPAHRRAGVGAALIRAAEAWARARGRQEIASDVEFDNVASQRAHASLGFNEVAPRRPVRQASLTGARPPRSGMRRTPSGRHPGSVDRGVHHTRSRGAWTEQISAPVRDRRVDRGRESPRW